MYYRAATASMIPNAFFYACRVEYLWEIKMPLSGVGNEGEGGGGCDTIDLCNPITPHGVGTGSDVAP